MTDEKRLLLGCACNHLAHAIQFQQFEDEDELYISLIIDPSPGFWGRVCQALRLILKKSPTLCDAILTPDSINKLEKFLRE